MLFVVLVFILILLLAALAAVNRIQVDEDQVASESDSSTSETQTQRVESGNERRPWIGVMPEEMRGVPYLLGRIRRKAIGPGLYVRFPLVYVIEGVIVQEQVVNVPRVDVSTRGGSTIGMRVALTIKVSDPQKTLAENRSWLPVVIERVKLELANSFSGMTAEMILSTRWDSPPEDGTETQRSQHNTRQAYLESRLREVLSDLHIEVVKAVVVDISIPENLQIRLSQLDTQLSDSAADSARADHESVLAEKYLAAARKHFEHEGEGDVSEEEVRAYARVLRRLATLEDLRVPFLIEGDDGNL